MCTYSLYKNARAGRVGVTCRVRGIGVPNGRKSLSARAYTMHTIPKFLHITDRLLPAEIDQIAELTEIFVIIRAEPTAFGSGLCSFRFTLLYCKKIYYIVSTSKREVLG